MGNDLDGNNSDTTTPISKPPSTTNKLNIAGIWIIPNTAKGILIIPELTMGDFIFGGTVGEQVRKSKNRCNPFF